MDKIITSVANAPIPVSTSDLRGPELITESDVRGAVREALYSPFASFERLAKILYDITRRNGTLLADSISNKYRWTDITPRCRSVGPYSPYCFSPPIDYAEEVVAAISCSDGPDQTNMTAAEFRKYWHKLRKESLYLGDRWARNRLMCVFWKLRPRATYPGMFMIRFVKLRNLTILIRSDWKLDVEPNFIYLKYTGSCYISCEVCSLSSQ